MRYSGNLRHNKWIWPQAKNSVFWCSGKHLRRIAVIALNLLQMLLAMSLLFLLGMDYCQEIVQVLVPASSHSPNTTLLGTQTHPRFWARTEPKELFSTSASFYTTANFNLLRLRSSLLTGTGVAFCPTIEQTRTSWATVKTPFAHRSLRRLKFFLLSLPAVAWICIRA